MVLLPLTSISNIHSAVGLQARMQCATAFVLAIPGLGHGLGFTLAGGADFPCVDPFSRGISSRQGRVAQRAFGCNRRHPDHCAIATTVQQVALAFVSALGWVIRTTGNGYDRW